MPRPTPAQTWRTARWIALAVAFGAAWTASSQRTTAAVRICEPHVSSGLVTGTSEQTAKAAALGLWKSKVVAQHGENHGSWRIAAEKSLQCLPRRDTMFECIARAAPCIIDQAPDRRDTRDKRMGI